MQYLVVYVIKVYIQTDMTISTPMLMLILNLYSLLGQRAPFYVYNKLHWIVMPQFKWFDSRYLSKWCAIYILACGCHQIVRISLSSCTTATGYAAQIESFAPFHIKRNWILPQNKRQLFYVLDRSWKRREGSNMGTVCQSIARTKASINDEKFLKIPTSLSLSVSLCALLLLLP